jgi:hypothetical protein
MKKNVFYALYYRIYRVVLKSSLNDVWSTAVPVYLSLLILMNLIDLNCILIKLLAFSKIFTNGHIVSLIAIILAILSSLFFGKKRRRMIIKMYSEETDVERKRGILFFSIYVFLTVLLAFAVPWIFR